MAFEEQQPFDPASFEHIPVLLNECLTGLAIDPAGTYLDGTAGGAGHSRQIALRLDAAKGGRLISLDQDPDAVQTARSRLAGLPATVVQINFRYAGQALELLGFEKFIGALLISLTMNTTFAPVFMTLHKITDTHILNNGGSLRALVRPIPMRRIISSLNWEVQWGFVFKKTIPFFWIPAHTITFLLAPQYQVLAAAVLGVMRGILRSVAAVAGRK